MKKIIRFVFLLIFLSFPFIGLHAQTDKEFWFGAPDLSSAHCDSSIQLRFVTLDQPAVVTVSEPANPGFTPITINIPANQAAVVDLKPFKNIVECSPGNVVDYGLHITSTQWIQANYEVACVNSEIFTLKGRNALGLNFIIPIQQTFNNGNSLTPPPVSSFTIVAVEDNTTVTIIPKQNIVGHTAGIPFTVTLNRGQAYQAAATSILASAHLGGSSVSSDKPIIVSTSDDSVVTTWGTCLDLLGDQLIPETKIGENYIVVKGFLPSNRDRINIYGTVDNTNIYIDGNAVPVSTVNRGTYYTFTLANPNTFIHTDNPVYVTHITGFGCELCDAVLPPLYCTGNNVVAFNHPTTNNFYGIVIVPAGEEGNFTVGGSSSVITPASFNVVPGTAGQWLAAMVNLTSITGPAVKVQNSSSKFIMGFLAGSLSGTNYGYFTDYGPMRLDLGNDTSVCPNNTLELNAGYPGSSYHWQDGSVNQTFTVTFPGTYSVTVTDIEGCSDTTSIYVGYFPIGTVTWPGVIQPHCVTDPPFLLTGGNPPGGTYSGMGVSSAMSSFYPSVGAGTYTIMYSAVDGNGCTQTAYNTVTIYPLPIVTFSGNLLDQCVTSTTYTLSGGMPAGGSYSGPGVTGSNFNASVAGPGIQQITYTYTDGNGCTNSSTNTITVHDIPLVTFNGTLDPQCETYDVYLLTGGSPLGGTYSGAGVTGFIFNASVAGVGTHVITYSYADIFGCIGTATKTILVHPSPIVTWSSIIPPMCLSASSVTLSGATPAGGVYYGPGTAGGAFSPSMAGLGTHTLTYLFMNSFGCSASATNTITVNPLPVPMLIGPSPVCAGSIGNIYTSDLAMSNYSWIVSPGGNITAGGNATSNTVTVTWNLAGLLSVSVNYSDANGCRALSDVIENVIVNPSPSPVITGPDIVCAGTTGNVYITEPGMNIYSWTVSAGGTITAGGTSTSNTIEVTWNTSGNQTVSVNYGDVNGCNAPAPTVYPVTVNALPVPGLTGTTSVCAGSTGIVYTTESGMSNYSWFVSAGGTITAGGTSGNNTVTVTWNTAGPQVVSVNYTDINNCTATSPTVTNITVNALPVPVLTGPSPVCTGSTGNVYTTDAGMSNYIWFVSVGGTITAGGTSASNTVTVTWNTAGPQTVSVNYRDLNGCMASTVTVKNVTVNQSPLPLLSGPLSVCAGSTGNVYTTESGMSNYTWIVSSGGTITAGGGNSNNAVTVTWNTVGPQTVSVNYTNLAGCTASSPTLINVTVNALPLINITGTVATCLNSTGNVYVTQSGMSNYTWTVSPGGTITAGGTATSNTVTVTWIIAGLQTVSVNFANASNCMASSPAVLNVTVNPLPVPTITGLTAVCVGTSGVVYTTEAGMTNYSWIVSAGGTITAGGTATSNTVTVTWNTVGAQSVSVNYLNANLCTATNPTIKNVMVNALPVPILTGPSPVCAGSIGNVYSTTAGMTNYSWIVSAGGTITAGGTASSNTVTITWNTPGAQAVTVNYTDAAGCTALTSTVKNVTVNPLPVPTITGPTTACAGSPCVNYVTATGMTNYTWAISGGGTITSGSGTNTICVSWLTAGIHTVTVCYTDANSCTCSTSAIHTVTVSSPASVFAGLDTTICYGSSITMSMATAQFYCSVIWYTTGDGTFADPSILNPVYTPGPQDIITGNFQLVMTGYGCAPCGNVSDTIIVAISPLTESFAGFNDTICADTTYTLSNAFVNNAGAMHWTTTGDGSFDDPTILHSVYIPGPNDILGSDVTLTLTADNPVSYCSDTSSSMMLHIKPLPPIHAGLDVAICAGDSVQLEASGGIDYVWLPATGLSDDSIANPYAFPSTTTTYFVSTTVDGCSNTDSVLVTVRPLPNLILSPDQHICQGDSALIWASGGSTWLWSTGSTDSSLWVTPPFSSIYYVTATDNFGCHNYAQAVVYIDPLPVLTVTPAESFICRGEFITISVQGAHSYSWSPSEGLSNAFSNMVLAGPLHTIDYTVTGTSLAGCKSSAHALIEVLPKPVLTLQDSAFLCRGDEMTFNAGWNENVTYMWQDSTISQYYTVNEPGIYYVTAYNAGCHVKDTLIVYPCAIFWVPSAFTPDGNNLNDKFYISATTEVLEYHLYIYSRKGELVFTSDDVSNVWDGKFKGDFCELGVFTWMIYYKSRDAGPQLMKGTVTLLR